MNINLDCFKDVLLFCVNNIDFVESHDSWNIQSVNLQTMYGSNNLSNYSKKDIMYSVVKLEECGFIKVLSKFPPNKPYLERCTIEDITYRGHQFIETVKEPTIWEKTKSIASKIGNHTIGFIEGTAHDIAVESAKQAVTIMMMQNNT